MSTVLPSMLITRQFDTTPLGSQVFRSGRPQTETVPAKARLPTVAGDAAAGLPGYLVLVQVDLFIFQAAPQPLRENVVRGAPAASRLIRTPTSVTNVT